MIKYAKKEIFLTDLYEFLAKCTFCTESNGRTAGAILEVFGVSAVRNPQITLIKTNETQKLYFCALFQTITYEKKSTLYNHCMSRFFNHFLQKEKRLYNSYFGNSTKLHAEAFNTRGRRFGILSSN